MAKSGDYRKPKNKEIQDLVLRLSHPLRVLSPAGKVLWQNLAAEAITQDEEWVSTPITWQNKKAELCSLALATNSEDFESQVGELKKEVARLKKAQRQTAKRKRQAESAAKSREKAFEGSEKREEKLRVRIESLEKDLAQVSRDKNALESEADPKALKKERKKSQQSLAALQKKLDASEQRTKELEESFAAFREESEAKDAQRELEEMLAAKVAEFEALERSLEADQSAFQSQKEELEAKLESQEKEFLLLKSSVGSQETKDEKHEEKLTDLNDEIEDLRADLSLALRKEKRVSDKLEKVEAERGKVEQSNKTLTADLEASRDKLSELEAKLERAQIDAQRAREAATEAEAANKKLEEAISQSKASAPSVGALKLKGADSGEQDVAIKNQLDFAKNRLKETEAKLDQTKAELDAERNAHKASKEAERLAFQDSLTGLPNSHMVLRYLDFLHKKAQSTRKAMGYFLIDLDGFRVLNDTFGKSWGDLLLKAVGLRLNGMGGGSHIFARHSHDRFVLLAADLDPTGARKFIDDASRSILEAIAHPFDVEGEKVNLTASVGAALGPEPGADSKALFQYAEIAVNRAKAKGGGDYCFYDDRLREALVRDVQYKRQMGLALEKDEFEVVFQPEWNLRKGIVTGAEMLMRWNRRDQQTLYPRDFLGVLIESGKIFDFAERFWPRVFNSLATWRKLRPGFTLSLNLSDKELLNPSLVERTKSWLQRAGVPPEAIVFEVRDDSRVRTSSSWWRLLEKLKRAGFGLCLDDYGSDASLLGTLGFHGFKVAKVEIDERNLFLPQSPRASKDLLYCAKRAEGKVDKKALTKAGFHLAQGFGISEPLESSGIDGVLS